jgi:hypothetical protein
MSDIEEFMASQELHRCAALCANITKETCKQNKKSGRIFSCDSCKGLGEKVEVSKTYRGVCPKCKRDDVLLTSKNGECYRCYKRGDQATATTRPMPAAPVKKEKPVVVSHGLALLTPEDISEIKGEPIQTNVEPIAEPTPEPVNHPIHYGGEDNPYEAIKVIEAWDLGFCLGNTVKYVSRCGKKSDKALEDLKKAAWYLDREIKRLSL